VLARFLDEEMGDPQRRALARRIRELTDEQLRIAADLVRSGWQGSYDQLETVVKT